MTATENLSALEIARIACDVETDGADFYERAAARIEDVDSRTLFKQLAASELQHLKTFRELYSRLESEMGGTESSSDYLFDDEIMKYLRTLSEGMVFPPRSKIDGWFSDHPTPQEIIRFAMEIEKSSILFYSQMVTHGAFAYSRELLDRVIREEQRHLVILRDMLKKTS